MFKRILVIDNFDSFTFNLVDYIEQILRDHAGGEGEVKVYRNNAEVEIIDEVNPDLIVLSPGPSIPKNAGNLMKMIAHAQDKYPIFGVCLGLEALIEHFGGSLKFTHPVHGKSSPVHHDEKTIFEGCDQDFLAGRYHSLSSDKVPDCFETSATCEAENEKLVMAIRHKELPIEAVQFHPESVLSMKKGNGFKLMENVLMQKK